MTFGADGHFVPVPFSPFLLAEGTLSSPAYRHHSFALLPGSPLDLMVEATGAILKHIQSKTDQV
jgi:hypothetical protein